MCLATVDSLAENLRGQRIQGPEGAKCFRVTHGVIPFTSGRYTDQQIPHMFQLRCSIMLSWISFHGQIRNKFAVWTIVKTCQNMDYTPSSIHQQGFTCPFGWLKHVETHMFLVSTAGPPGKSLLLAVAWLPGFGVRASVRFSWLQGGGCCIPFWAAFDPHLWSFLSIPDALAFIVHKNNFCHIQAFVPFNSRISIPRACFIGKQIWAFSLVCFAEPTDFVFLGRTNWGPLANEPAAIGLCEASWVSVNLEGMGMDEHYWRNLTLFCLNTRMFFLWARESSETAGFLKQPPSGGLDQQFWPTSRFNTNWAQLSLWNAQPTTGNLITSV